MTLRPIDRILFIAGTLFLGAWFAALAGSGLRVWFSGDDMMNLYGAWTTPWPELLRANVWFFGPYLRPAGSLWYRGIFAVAGFDPWAFHAVTFVFLAVNCLLVYSLAHRLSGRREVAAIAALIASYNARFVNLYFDTGAIYDVLCFCFYLGALLWYVRIRQRGVYLSAAQLGGFAALQIAALNSKEMAVTLPLALLAYEAVYHAPRHHRARAWVFDEARGVLLSGAIALLFAAGKAFGPDALTSAPGYRLTLTAGRAMANIGIYLDHLFYRYDSFTPGGAFALWMGMLAVAVVSRSRALIYAWCFLSFSISPLLFVEPRAGSAIYVCLFGWALFGAALAAWLTDPVRRWIPSPWKGASVFLTVAAILWPLHRFEGRFTSQSATQSSIALEATNRALHRAQRAFRPNSRILFLNDPIRPDVHDLMFLVRLGYYDPTLQVERVLMSGPHPHAQFDYVLDYVNQQFLVLKRPVR